MKTTITALILSTTLASAFPARAQMDPGEWNKLFDDITTCDLQAMDYDPDFKSHLDHDGTVQMIGSKRAIFAFHNCLDAHGHDLHHVN